MILCGNSLMSLRSVSLKTDEVNDIQIRRDFNTDSAGYLIFRQIMVFVIRVYNCNYTK
jgi:hypothetical protein